MIVGNREAVEAKCERPGTTLAGNYKDGLHTYQVLHSYKSFSFMYSLNTRPIFFFLFVSNLEGQTIRVSLND